MTTLVTGAGDPVTVVAHGLGGSVAQTRPLLGGVGGTKVFLQARGHGDAPPPQRAGYAELAGDLAATADRHGATQALGVSLGAHTILRLLTCQPDRFARVVLFLPAAIDARDDYAVRRVADLSAALATRDPEAIRSVVRTEVPDGVHAEAYVAARTAFLSGSPGLIALLEGIADDVPVPRRSALAAVTAEVLVLAQEGDPLHPAQTARELVGLLPRSRLVVFDAPGVLFRERARLRELVGAHLNP